MPDPTTAEVRTTYALAFNPAYQAEAFAEFDRWLAGVLAQTYVKGHRAGWRNATTAAVRADEIEED